MENLASKFWRYRRLLIVISIALLVWVTTNQILPRITTSKVVISAHELSPGEKITKQDLLVKEVPTAIIGDNVFKKTTPLIGSTIALTIPAKTVILPAMILGKTQLPKKLKNQAVISVSVPESDLRLVHPGAKIIFYLSGTPPTNTALQTQTKDLKPQIDSISATVLSVVKESKGLMGADKTNIQVAVDKKYVRQLLHPSKAEDLRLALS